MGSGEFTPIQRVVILGAPLLLGLLEIWHPALGPQDNICSTLEAIKVWWTVLHVLQIPLFAFLGVTSYLLLRRFTGRIAMLGRVASLVFAVVYPASGRLAPWPASACSSEAPGCCALRPRNLHGQQAPPNPSFHKVVE
jgi:hypothetical protein